jgi:hypothetical protein
MKILTNLTGSADGRSAIEAREKWKLPSGNFLHPGSGKFARMRTGFVGKEEISVRFSQGKLMKSHGKQHWEP